MGYRLVKREQANKGRGLVKVRRPRQSDSSHIPTVTPTTFHAVVALLLSLTSPDSRASLTLTPTSTTAEVSVSEGVQCRLS